eukprot:2614941-Amphidinium_carterae.1
MLVTIGVEALPVPTLLFQKIDLKHRMPCAHRTARKRSLPGPSCKSSPMPSSAVFSPGSTTTMHVMLSPPQGNSPNMPTLNRTLGDKKYFRSRTVPRWLPDGGCRGKRLRNHFCDIHCSDCMT